MPPSGREPRRRPKAWELRAAVTEKAYSHYDKEAQELGRSRSWHVGMVVQAFYEVAEQLTPTERASLDRLLREPGEFLVFIKDRLHPGP